MSDPPLNQVPEAAYLQAIVDAAPRVILVLDAAGHHRFGLDGRQRVLVGIPASELIGRNLLDFVADDDAPPGARVDGVRPPTRPGRFRPMEFRYRRADGSIGVAEAVSTNQLADPRLHGIVAAGPRRHRASRDRPGPRVHRRRSDRSPTMLRLVARLVEEPARRTAAPSSAIDPVDGRFAVAASVARRRSTSSPCAAADTSRRHRRTSPSAPPATNPLPWAPVIEDGRARIHADLASLPPACRPRLASRASPPAGSSRSFLPVERRHRGLHHRVAPPARRPRPRASGWRSSGPAGWWPSPSNGATPRRSCCSTRRATTPSPRLPNRVAVLPATRPRAAAGRAPRGRALPRPRRLQVDQRPLRPPGRRPGADHVARASRGPAPGRPGGPPRRRRVRRHLLPTCRRPTRPSRSPSGSSTRSASR